MSVEAKLTELGIELPAPPKPAGNYVGGVQVGNILFMSGCGPSLPEGGSITGKVGGDLSVEDGYGAARQVGINMLANIKAQVGDLDRVKRVVKVLGMVNANPDFKDHPKVINGASDLIHELFGKDDLGYHARSALGYAQLPTGAAVEIEAIFAVEK